MKFQEELSKQIEMLESKAKNTDEPVLRHIIELLKDIHSPEELQSSAGLIQHIIIDSLEDWSTVEEVMKFIERNKKKKK